MYLLELFENLLVCQYCTFLQFRQDSCLKPEQDTWYM